MSIFRRRKKLWTRDHRPAWAVTPSDPTYGGLARQIDKDLREGAYVSLGIGPNVLRVSGDAWGRESVADHRGTVAVIYFYLLAIGKAGPLEVRDAATEEVLAEERGVPKGWGISPTKEPA